MALEGLNAFNTSSQHLVYGQKLRLLASSSYISRTSTASLDVGIGFYEKNGRHGILNAVPPLGPSLDHLFKEDEYTVLDPTGVHKPGEVVLFGHKIVLVNQLNLVWNNKTGGITGYIGPRARNIPGEMFVCFQQPSAKKTPPKGATFNSSSQLNEPVAFGDSIVVEVAESNRHSSSYNKRLTNFKKQTSSILGGYICCDGKGQDLLCVVAPPKYVVKQIKLTNKILTGYKYGQIIDVIGNENVEIKLSHDKHVVLTPNLWTDLPSDTNEPVFVPLQNGPGGVLVHVSNSTSNSDSKAANGQANGHSSANRPSVLMKLSNVVHSIPIHYVSVFVVVSSVVLAILKRSDLVPQVVIMFIAGCIWTPAMFLLMTGTTRNNLNLISSSNSSVSNNFDISVKRQITLLEYTFQKNGTVDTGSIEDSMSYAENIIPINVSSTNRTETFPSTTTSSSNSKSRANSNASTASNVMDGVTLKSSSEVNVLDVPKIPKRFLKAVKGDEAQALIRWKDTLRWRSEEKIDGIVAEKMPHFRLIKENYPHYYHKRGKNNEPVYYEKPGKINLKALKQNGVVLDDLLRNYSMISEFLWRVIEKDDDQKCITVIDVEGIGFSDFGGEVVEYIRKASAFTGKHYPERCAFIFIINVPSWFNMVWNVVKGMIDDVTRQKVNIIRGKNKIHEALAERIPDESIPAEYGGQSEGNAPEEDILFKLMDYNNGVTCICHPIIHKDCWGGF